MSDHIFFDGAKYISAADAAETHSLSRDYVAKLCREGKVVGKRVGKNWYVNDLSFKEFLIAQEYHRSRRRESLVEERTREYQQLNGFAEEAQKPRPARELVPTPAQSTSFAERVATLQKKIQGDIALAAQSAPVHIPVIAHVKAMREKASGAVAKHGQVFTHAMRDLSHAGLPDAAIRSVAHAPLYSISPVGELAHKVVALALALMMTFGTYAALDPQYARFAMESARDSARDLAASYESLTGGGVSRLANRTEAQVKGAVENPGASLAAAASFFPETLATMAKAFNSQIDNFVYAVAFPDGLVDRADADGASVAVEIAPYARANNSQLATTAEDPRADTPKPATPAPIVQQPVVERIIERIVPANAVAVAGGLTDEYLSDRLNQLENKLSAQMYRLASANSTTIVQNYNVAAQTNKIDELERVDILDSDIRRGTIADAAISGGTITNTAISASSLSVSGVTSLASLDLSGDITLGGSLNFSSSSSTISATLASTTNLISTNATTTNLVMANSTSTGSALFQGTLRISDANAPANGTLSFGNSTARLFFNSSDYTFYGGSVYTNAGRFVSIGNNESLGLGVRYVNGDGTFYLGASHSFTPDLIFTNSGLTERMRLSDAGLLSFEMASTTRLSVFGTAYFGGSATTTIDSAGNVAVAGTLGVTGDTMLSNATTSNLYSTTASSTYLFSTNVDASQATLRNATSTTFFATIASSTNLYAALANLGSTTVQSLTVGSGVSSGGLSVNGNGYFSGGLGIGVATTAAGVLQTSGNAWVGGNLHVVGNSTVLGASTADTLSINSSINSHLIPNQNITYDLGSGSFYWRNVYVGNIVANNISAASTTIAGTASATFTINSDNVTADTEDMDLIFFRGNVVPNALISWKTATKRFELNQSTYISNQSGSTTQPTLRLQGVAGQTGNLFEIASSTGQTMFSVDATGATLATGFVSQASSTVIGNFTVTGNGLFASSTLGYATSTTFFATTASSTNLFAQSAQFGALTILGATTQSGLATFTNGFLSQASSTIGSGTQAGGLTIYGGATTTGNAYFAGTLGVGTNSLNASARLQIDSTSGGFLPPRMTTVQKNAISSPSFGLVVYDTTLNKLNVYNGSAWKNVGSTELGGEVTSGTANSVLFIDNGTTGPVLEQDNANFSYASSTRTLSATKFTTTNATSSTFFATTASSTNLFAQAASFGSLTLPNFAQNRVPYLGASGAVTSGSGLTYDGTTLTAGNLTSAGDVSLGFATSSTFFATTASSTNLYAQTGTVGALFGKTANLSSTLTITRDNSVASARALAITQTGAGPSPVYIDASTWTAAAALYVLQNTSGAFGGFYEANDPGVIPMHLKGNASQTANYFTIGRGSSAGDVLAVSGAGNLGVGSSTPWAKLSVKGAGTTTGVNFQTTDSADTPLFTVLDNGGTTMLYATSTTFFATTASSTNLFAQTAALGALSAGSLTVSGNTTHTGTLTQTGLATFTNGFVSQASSTVVGNFTTSGNGIFSGTFGIGTTSPAATLGVNGTAYLSGTASLTAPSLIIGGQNRLELGNSSGSNMAWIAASGINTNLILRSQTNVGVSSSTLSIYPGAKFSVSGGVAVGSDFYTTAVTDGNMIVSGNVGVGSSSPFAKLSIKGAGSTTGINFQTTDTNNLSLFSILDNGGTTMLYATSTTFFATTASSTNLFAATGAIGALSAGSLTVSGNTIHTGTLTQTGLASFVQASTTRLSVHGTAYFGGTATTTIDSAGNLAVAGTLGVSGNTTLANATSSAFFATTASSTNLFAQAASFGSLALPSFAQNRVPYFGAAGAVTSGSGFTYDGTTLTAGNLTSAGAVSLGFATSTTSFATTASSTNLFAAIASVGQLSIPNLGTAAGTFLAADPTGKLIATSSPGLSGTTGQIAYLSGTNTAVGTSTLFITTGSNVGIGTTSPQAKLDIVRTSAGATADVLAISNLSSATSTASRLLFRTGDLTNNTGTTTAAITSLLTQNYTAAKGDLIFSTLASGALTEAMRLTSTGLLGIGTSTPTHRLSVANAASAPQFSLSYNSGAWTTQQVDASGNWTQTSSGGYNIFSNDNVEICANGSCPTTTATSTAGNLFVENAVVIGDGFSLREIDGLSLGLYNVAGGLMVTFDNNN